MQLVRPSLHRLSRSLPKVSTKQGAGCLRINTLLRAMQSDGYSSDEWANLGASYGHNPGRPPLHSRNASGWDAYSHPRQPPIYRHTPPRQAPRRYSHVSAGASHLPPRGGHETYPSFHRRWEDEYINPPRHAYVPPEPENRPRMHSRRPSGRQNFAKPATVSARWEAPLRLYRSPAVFACVMQHPNDRTTEIAPMVPNLLQKRDGTRYCLGSQANGKAVKKYVENQMSTIVQLYHEAGEGFQFGDRVKVDFLPVGQEYCVNRRAYSCGKLCGRRVLVVDQLVAAHNTLRIARA